MISAQNHRQQLNGNRETMKRRRGERENNKQYLRSYNERKNNE
jgi:hypothetical protein